MVVARVEERGLGDGDDVSLSLADTDLLAGDGQGGLWRCCWTEKDLTAAPVCAWYTCTDPNTLTWGRL